MTEKECGDSEGVVDRWTTKALRGLGKDLNGFKAEIKWRTLYAPSEEKNQTIEWMSGQKFESLLMTPFFDDLLKKGPLLIEEIYFKSMDPERSYVVHDDLVKAMNASFAKFKDVNPSFARKISIDVVLDKAESGKFTQAVNLAMKLFKIRPLFVHMVRDSDQKIIDGNEELKTVFELLFQKRPAESKKHFETENGHLKCAFVVGVEFENWVKGEFYSLKGIAYEGKRARFSKIEQAGFWDGSLRVIFDTGLDQLSVPFESVIGITEENYDMIERNLLEKQNRTSDSAGVEDNKTVLPKEYEMRAEEYMRLDMDEEELRKAEEIRRIQSLYGNTAYPGDMRDISELEKEREKEQVSFCSLL